jgi:hypothetical protein
MATLLLDLGLSITSEDKRLGNLSDCIVMVMVAYVV